MPTLLVHAGDDTPRWLQAFAAADPGLRVVAPEQPVAPETIDYIAAWKPPPGLFARYPALKAVFALGAGVDRFLARDDLPAAVPLLRLVDAGMAAQMIEYVLIGVLAWQRRLPDYAEQQALRQWRPLAARPREAVRVGVLGLGAIGGAVAGSLATMGYAVKGWSRTPRDHALVPAGYGEAALDALLVGSDVLVNLLPSTPATRGLLDAARLARLPSGGYVINAARGDQLDADALLAAIERGHIAGALLDVFATEPLPPDSPLWRHPRVTITPHVAAMTLPGPAAAQVLDAIAALEAGRSPDGRVARERGY